ncbi:hypothetical protein T09_10494 [Trichinella sp. T9]|nr:hypothetical protein T09_10494 [Trichinella sp. T9]
MALNVSLTDETNQPLSNVDELRFIYNGTLLCSLNSLRFQLYIIGSQYVRYHPHGFDGTI